MDNNNDSSNDKIESVVAEVQSVEPNDPINRYTREVFDWIEMFVFSAAFVLILFTFFMRLAIVKGPSMEETLHERDALVISNLFYEPEQGDIIIFQSPSSGYEEPIVKRVIADSGQVVDIDFSTWTVTVDGVKLDETYVNRESGFMNSSSYEYPYTVPDGKIFVMGDNRNHSMDSRDNRIGPVDKRFILGEVKLRLFPFNKFGIVN